MLQDLLSLLQGEVADASALNSTCSSIQQHSQWLTGALEVLQLQLGTRLHPSALPLGLVPGEVLGLAVLLVLGRLVRHQRTPSLPQCLLLVLQERVTEHLRQQQLLLAAVAGAVVATAGRVQSHQCWPVAAWLLLLFRMSRQLGSSSDKNRLGSGHRKLPWRNRVRA